MKQTLVVCSLICLVFTGVSAQDLPFPLEMPLPGVSSYSTNIPKPEDVVGHEIGTRHTEPHLAVSYFRAVANISDRVVFSEHGLTYEGRPLVHVIVTSPSNHSRLEAIHEAQLRLSDAPSDVSDDMIAEMPAVVYMAYSIHGGEASGTEAALLLLYHLAAGNGTAIDDILDHVVVIIDPMLNPDGRTRFTTWVNQNRGAVAVADPNDREHSEHWPGGRTNHYWFDLNRDWLPAQHPESQARLALFHQWRPQLLTDFHEMGSNATFFFQPGHPSRNNPNTPSRTYELTAEIAAFHARGLDRIGSLYYSGESFDDFYLGKGSAYPDINGGIGILFEQASSSGLKIETAKGELSFAFTVRNQFSASLSSLDATVALREKLLRNQRDFYKTVSDFVDRNPVKAYVIDTAKNRTRAQALAILLQQHRVKMYQLAKDYRASERTFSGGEAMIIPIRQPQARLIKAFMERSTTFQDSLFYDVSTWTLPLAFGLPSAELTQDPTTFVGDEMVNVEYDGGELVGGRSDYAYVMEWGRYFAPRALYKLQSAGVRTVLMTTDYEAVIGNETTPFPRGSIIIPVKDGALAPDALFTLIERIVREDHVRVFAVSTGLTPNGPDLGSPQSELIEKPEIALLTGSGTSSGTAGEVWHLLSERFRIPITLIDVNQVSGADMDRYNTVIMAGGSYGDLPSEWMQDWVRNGGTLIAIRSAINWMIRNELVSLEQKTMDIDSLLTEVPYDQISTARGAQQIGGSIFELKLDPTHPIAYGYDASIPFFRQGTTFFEPPETPGSNVGRYGEAPLLSGYITDELHASAENSAAIIAQRSGRGHIILFTDDPNFRAFWYGTNGLFLNSVFFGGAY